jgi:hypothetical protein
MAEAINDVDSVLKLCRENGRVCPQPQKWQQLWELLPDKRPIGVGWQPSLPLILGGWWHSSDEDKRQRLEAHIHWATEHGGLESVAELLRSLMEEDWHHENQ